MKILIVGSGGREHALAWKMAQSPLAEKIFVAPGNAGTAIEPAMENVDIDVLDVPALIKFAQSHHVDLTVIGPEAPLVIGVVDKFQAAGLACLGPSQASARLEGSKAFTKDFMDKYKIPTAAYGNFSELEPALSYIRQQALPMVIKADGLAAGKGVIIAQTVEEAEDAARSMLQSHAFGEAGQQIVVEEFLEGEEASFIVLVDGKNILPFASSQDHKARDNGDKGPNTGGMGAYSPAPVVDEKTHQRIMAEVIEPTVKAMEAEGCPYTGFLYAGIMLDSDGTPKVLEFNCRFGDPETQPIMMRLESDFVELCLHAVNQTLDQAHIKWHPKAALGVVMAAGGYPEQYEKGMPISGLNHAVGDELKVFHAGTNFNDKQEVCTAGGRVLCVTALGDTVSEAQNKAYQGVSKVSWQDTYYRTDIGHRAIKREA